MFIKYFPAVFLVFRIPAYSANFDCTRAPRRLKKRFVAILVGFLDEDLLTAYKKALNPFLVLGYLKAEQNDWLSLLKIVNFKTDCSTTLIK